MDSFPSFFFVAPEMGRWAVKIRSIKLTEFNNGLEPECNPSKIHLFVNRENLGFEDCEDVDPTQTLHLTSEELKENAEPIQLKFVKFQRVKSLTLFIEDNQGEMSLHWADSNFWTSCRNDEHGRL